MPELWAHDTNTEASLEERMQKRFYCLPADPDYKKVVNRRQKWSLQRRDNIIASIDALFDAIAAKSCTLPKVIPCISIPDPESIQQSGCEQTDRRSSKKNEYRLPDHIGQEELARLWLSPCADNEKAASDISQDTAHPSIRSNTSCAFSILASTICFAAFIVGRSSFSVTLGTSEAVLVVPESSCRLAINLVAIANVTFEVVRMKTSQFPYIPSSLTDEQHAKNRDNEGSIFQRDDWILRDQQQTSGETRSISGEDAEVRRIVERLSDIFDRRIVVEVLSENASRDLYVLADICAQKSS
uniref:MADF domain-containing protein n=1 Tax=Ascaris lumbricoides TaxID=6252 RepID=A0A0M3IKI5_ASCLU